MRYFRYYPWVMQLLLFMLLTFTMWFVTYYLMGLFSQSVAGLPLNFTDTIDAHSPYQVIKMAKIIEGTSSVLFFLLPALLFAYFCHPKPLGYLGLKKPGKMIQLLLVALMMLGALPVLQTTETLMSHIHVSEAVHKAQMDNDRIMTALLIMPDTTSLLYTLFIFSIIPAMGEELFFRGVLLRMARKKSRNMVFPVFFTAMIFSAAHYNFYGFISIFIAGILLASIYYYTGSLWCSMLAHAIFNGTQIILSYGADHNRTIKNLTESSQLLWVYGIGGVFLFFVSFYLLVNKYATPLANDWADDMKGEQPKESDITTVP